MPELPEVHTTKEGLRKNILNLKISNVWSDYFIGSKNKRKDNIKDKKFFENFKKEIIGEKVLDVERIGKNILIHLSSSKTILIHMKMTGHLLFGKYIWNGKNWVAKDDGPLKDPFNRFIHFLMEFKNGKHLAFSDTRKFAKVTLFESGLKKDHPDLKIIGPDPIDNSIDFKILKERLFKRPTGKIKTVLMDQTILAGIGNIYSDEILWASEIHPERKVETLSNKNIKDILKNMVLILKKSISMGGDSMSDYRNTDGEKGGFQKAHKVYKRKNMQCLKKNCSGVIKRKIIAGRSSHFCPIHQK